VKQLEIGNADVENLEARGHKTGGCYARYQPFSSIKPGTRRAGLAGRFQNPSTWVIGMFIKEGWKIVMREKDSWINDWQKKGSAFFRQGMLRKMCGCEAAEKKGDWKYSSKAEMPIIFVKENYLGTPLYTMC
jgi:hypothetical protein